MGTRHTDSLFPQLIFAGADLPAFCTALLLGGKTPDVIFGSSLLINVHCNTLGENEGNRASFSTPLVKRLLEPLRSLYSFGFAQITGPLDERYMEELCVSICKKGPSFRESFLGVLDIVREGDEAFDNQNSTVDCARATKLYNAAVKYLKDRCSGHYLAIRVGLIGWRPGVSPYSDESMNLYIAYTQLLGKLQLNLATAHFRLRRYAQSRKWSLHAIKEGRLSGSCRETASLLNVRSNQRLGRWGEASARTKLLLKDAPHLEPELKRLKEQEKTYKNL